MGTMRRVENESNGKAALVSKFMDEMMPTKLFFRSPTRIDDYWVFWSHNHTSIGFDIQNRIKDAICDFSNYTGYFGRFLNVLIQFWGAEEGEIEGEVHLTTALQPFAFSYRGIESEKLKEYRKHCVGYKLLVSDEAASGIVGRVFRNQLPEFGPDPESYSVNEYPQRDFAVRCGIMSIMAFPVFQHPGVACVGVLELLFPETTDFMTHFVRVGNVCKTLKEHHLSTTDLLHFSSQIAQIYNSHIQNEIRTAMKQVCTTYRIPLGVIWVSFPGELLVPSLQMSFFNEELLTLVNWSWMWSWSGPLRVNQGLVGKTFSSRDLYYCRDVTQLSISEYPQILFARKFGLAASFTACLRNISTGNHDLVIEFFLDRETTYNQDLHSLFNSILATVNQQLRSFKVVTGDMYIDIANETHIQREQSSNTSYKTLSSCSKSEGDSSQSNATEYSVMSTCKKRDWLSLTLVNESDQFIPKSSFPVNTREQRAESESSGWGNSETASTKWMKLYGYNIYGHQSDTLSMNRSQAESLSSGMRLSVVSGIYPDVEMITDEELMTIKVSYNDHIISFRLPHSSSYADLMESILHRWSLLKDMSFVIKYLNDSNELVLLATDMDLQKCMAWTRSKHMNTIKTVIELQ